MPIKQDDRWIAIETPLGKDVLGLQSFSVHEQLSQLFEIEADLRSENGAVDLDKVVGHEVTIRMNLANKAKRYFHGYVSRMVQEGKEGFYTRYRASIVPRLWFLTRTSDCRLWAADSPDAGKTVVQIIQDVFERQGLSNNIDYVFKLEDQSKYPKREFCVQYRESDFNFVSRLLEQEGIYYFFELDENTKKHRVVLTNSASQHKPFSGYEEVGFQHMEPSGPVREMITGWTVKKEVQPVASVLQDFDFQKPKNSLLATSKTSRKYGQATLEVFDYPGKYIQHPDGERLASVRLAELQTQYETLYGEASSRGLAAGSTFTLKKHPRNDQNRKYLITGVSLSASAGEFVSSGASGEGDTFSCSFSCIDEGQQFRPPRMTPKPVVQGPQTAIVVGPSGEEIYTEANARVKVHFHWNRHDKSDQDSSCWVRVSQYWAGKTWGAIHIPRMGQEVIVEFLEGDPDRPIITGRVYNGDQTPPYPLPDNKTQSGIKSRSSKGGGSPNFNEIRFEDKMGSEELYIHAEKDQNNVVENNETTKVGNNRTENVANNETISIGNNRTENVGNNEAISVGANRTETVQGNEQITISGNRSESVTKDESVSISGNRTLMVSKDESVTVDGKRVEQVAKTETVEVGKDREHTITGKDTLTVGKELLISVKEKITLETGDASIILEKDGTIQIKGKDITITGSGNITAKASSDVTIKGSSTKIN